MIHAMAVSESPSQLTELIPNKRNTLLNRPLVSLENSHCQMNAQEMEATRWGQKNAVCAKLLILRFFCSHTANSSEKEISSVYSRVH